MRILILYANPSPASFGSALHRQAAQTLQEKGHWVDDCDLYADGFDPVLTEENRRVYRDPEANRAQVSGYVSRLPAAEGLVLVYPVWNEGFPAILKGFLDRIFLPGVSFKIANDGSAAPKLRKLAAVCTYGASWPITLMMGDPSKKVVKRLLRSLPVHRVRCDYLAQYGVDSLSAEHRQAFLRKVIASCRHGERCAKALQTAALGASDEWFRRPSWLAPPTTGTRFLARSSFQVQMQEEHMPKEAHTKAADHHETAAKSHRTAAEHHGRGDHEKGRQESMKATEQSKAARDHSETAHGKSQSQK